MQSNSYVFGASMSSRGFAVPMSSTFGDTRGGLVAGNDPMVTEVEAGVSVQRESRSRLRRWKRSQWIRLRDGRRA